MVEDLLLLAGSIIYYSQMIEHNLRVIVYLDTRLDQKDRKISKDELLASDLLDLIQTESMGKLINICQEFQVFTKKDLKYLRSVTPKRNNVAHKFFIHADFNGRIGNKIEEEKMINELSKIEKEFKYLHNEILTIIKDYEQKGARY